MHPLSVGVLSIAACVLTAGAVAQSTTADSANASNIANQPTFQLKPLAAQPAGSGAKRPEQVGYGFLSSMGASMRFESSSRLSAGTVAALRQMGGNAAPSDGVTPAALPALNTIPYWMGSFSLMGTNYPYSMVGNKPQRGGITLINFAIIPISLIFDGFKDVNGNKITIDVTPTIAPLIGSPNLQKATYSTGVAQFADAVQRAEFWSVPQVGTLQWHTQLRQPRILTPVQVEVPDGLATLHQAPDGTMLAIINPDFFKSQLFTIEQLEQIHDNEIALAVTSNAVLGLSLTDCCITGYHNAFEQSAARPVVHVFAWASYLAPGLFSGGIEDVTAISHIIANTIDNPFVNNLVPPWVMPTNNPPSCLTMLEIGDPVQALPNAVFPVTINGTTYHPQNDALLQWFERKNPSDAIHGAYSYPDETVLTTPSTACTPAP